MSSSISNFILLNFGWNPRGISHVLWTHELLMETSEHQGFSTEKSIQCTLEWIKTNPATLTLLMYPETQVIKLINILQNMTEGKFPYILDADFAQFVRDFSTDFHLSCVEQKFYKKVSDLDTHLVKLKVIEPANYIHTVGSITKANSGIVAQGVNCQGAMGSGVAKAILTKWPIVYKQFIQTYNTIKPKLGHVDYVQVDPILIVANCYTQEFFGGDGKRYADLNAVKTCLEQVFDEAVKLSLPIHLPRIASDLGGLSWTYEVQPLIVELATKYPSVDVYVYCLPETQDNL